MFVFMSIPFFLEDLLAKLQGTLKFIEFPVSKM